MQKPGKLPLLPLFVALAFTLSLAGCASLFGDGQGRAFGEREPVAPLNAEQQMQLARALNLTRGEQYGAALEVLQAVQAARPEVGLIDARMGWVLQQQGRGIEAQAAYRRALEKAPREPMATNNLALILQSEGEFAEARELFEAGLKDHPDAPELHYNLAVLAELYLLDLPLALEHYRRYQALTNGREKQVTGWIADLERRVN